MKILWLFPMAFVAGAHGFAMLAPYLAAMAAVTTFVYARRQNV